MHVQETRRCPTLRNTPLACSTAPHLAGPSPRRPRPIPILRPRRRLIPSHRSPSRRRSAASTSCWPATGRSRAAGPPVPETTWQQSCFRRSWRTRDGRRRRPNRSSSSASSASGRPTWPRTPSRCRVRATSGRAGRKSARAWRRQPQRRNTPRCSGRRSMPTTRPSRSSARSGALPSASASARAGCWNPAWVPACSSP